MIASSFLYIPLLLALAQARSPPTCMAPPSPPEFLPNIDDCRRLCVGIDGVSSIQRDVPQVWSRASPVHGSGVPLPHTFSLQDNNCAVLVDTVDDGASDIFPTREISFVTRVLISECLVSNRRSGSTLGYIWAGPRQQILVILTKNYGSQMVTGKDNTAPAFNGTELAVMEVAVDSSANLTSAE